MKGRVIENILYEMEAHIDSEALDKLKGILWKSLRETELVTKSTETSLVKSNDLLSSRAYQMFFIAKKIEGLSDRSLVYYKLEIDGFLTHCSKSPDLVETDDIRYYLATRGSNCSKVTLNNKRRVLNSFFVWLTNEEYIPKNPMAKIKSIRQPKKLKQPFAEDDIEKLRDQCRDTRELAIVDILLSTGMRCGELHELNRSSVDLQRGEVIVHGKGDKQRICYLNAKAKKHIADYLSSRTDHEECLIAMCGKHKPKRLGINGIELLIRKLGKRAGVDNAHPHRFRRTAATLAINRGMPIEQVQQMLGHEKIETTTQYAVVARENVKIAHGKYLP